jgi:hypothetical protein
MNISLIKSMQAGFSVFFTERGCKTNLGLFGAVQVVLGFFGVLAVNPF